MQGRLSGQNAAAIAVSAPAASTRGSSVQTAAPSSHRMGSVSNPTAACCLTPCKGVVRGCQTWKRPSLEGKKDPELLRAAR